MTQKTTGLNKIDKKKNIPLSICCFVDSDGSLKRLLFELEKHTWEFKNKTQAILLYATTPYLLGATHPCNSMLICMPPSLVRLWQRGNAIFPNQFRAFLISIQIDFLSSWWTLESFALASGCCCDFPFGMNFSPLLFSFDSTHFLPVMIWVLITYIAQIWLCDSLQHYRILVYSFLCITCPKSCVYFLFPCLFFCEILPWILVIWLPCI